MVTNTWRVVIVLALQIVVTATAYGFATEERLAIPRSPMTIYLPTFLAFVLQCLILWRSPAWPSTPGIKILAVILGATLVTAVGLIGALAIGVNRWGA
jgi:hypothetical protein